MCTSGRIGDLRGENVVLGICKDMGSVRTRRGQPKKVRWHCSIVKGGGEKCSERQKNERASMYTLRSPEYVLQ